MTHQEAIAGGIVERYMLGELDSTERDAFENHYFECSVCAAQLHDLQKLTAAVKTANPLTADTQASARPRLIFSSRLVPIAAAAAGLAVASYQGLVLIPRLRTSASPFSAPGVTFRFGARSGSEVPVVGVAQRPLLLFVDVPVENRWRSYGIRVLRPSGGLVVNFEITAADAVNSVPLAFPAGVLDAGVYLMELTGHNAQGVEVIGANRFEIR